MNDWERTRRGTDNAARDQASSRRPPRSGDALLSPIDILKFSGDLDVPMAPVALPHHTSKAVSSHFSKARFRAARPAFHLRGPCGRPDSQMTHWRSPLDDAWRERFSGKHSREQSMTTRRSPGGHSTSAVYALFPHCRASSVRFPSFPRRVRIKVPFGGCHRICSKGLGPSGGGSSCLVGAGECLWDGSMFPLCASSERTRASQQKGPP